MTLAVRTVRNAFSAIARAPLAPYLALCVLLFGDAARVLAAVTASTPQQTAFLRIDAAATVAATLVLIAAGHFAMRRGHIEAPLAGIIGAAAGLLFFARTLGFALADPTTIGWLLNGDWAQHYSGWAMFRDTPWSWPPGRLPEVWYPIGTSIVYTDSLPLLALLLKPFSAWLPHPFQYIGLWFLVNCVLQGGFGALLVARATRSPVAVLAGAALFVFAPLFISRTGHDTLTAQWLLLAALWLYFRAPSARLLGEAWPWWILTGIAALVHPYLAAMTLAMQAAYWWKRTRDSDALPKIDALAGIGTSFVLALAMWWLCGAMTIRAADSSGGIAYGLYSFNLLGFFNPMNYSNLLPNLPMRHEQYEGFSYLGAGMIALVLLALVDLVRERRILGDARDWTPLFVAALALVVLAVGTVVAIGSWTLIDHPIRSRWLGLFRASGRFVWVAYYTLMLLALVHVLRRYSPHTGAVIIILALAVQIFDLSAAHARIAKLRLRAQADAPIPLLDDPGWERLAAGRRHLTLLPPVACGVTPGPYLPMQLFAADHGLTFNSGYLARWNLRATGLYCNDLHDRLAKGDWSADDLYVVGATWKERFEASAPAARCERLDGYDACIVDGAAPR